MTRTLVELSKLRAQVAELEVRARRVVDLGRTRRFHTQAQRTAIAVLRTLVGGWQDDFVAEPRSDPRRWR